jgi:hypothetical protein
VAQGEGPEFKPEYLKENKERKKEKRVSVLGTDSLGTNHSLALVTS